MAGAGLTYRDWRERVPELLEAAVARWGLTLGAAYPPEPGELLARSDPETALDVLQTVAWTFDRSRLHVHAETVQWLRAA